MSQGTNFAIFGYSFQVKVLASLLSDRRFIISLSDHLLPDYFESKALRWVLKVTKKYFEEYRVAPTVEVFKILLSDLQDRTEVAELKSTLSDVFNATSSTELPFVKDKAVAFCKEQAYLNANRLAPDLIYEGKFEEVSKMFQKLAYIGQDNTLGTNYKEDIESRYTVENRKPITTGWSEIDAITKGGLAAGELGLVIAPPGVGKSWSLLKISSAAVIAGKTVMHHTLELNEAYNGFRYDSIFSGVPLDNLPDNIPFVKKVIEQVKGNLYIKWHPTKKFSPDGLRSSLDRAHLFGTFPDVVTVDYADLMRFPKTFDGRKDELIQELYEELRSIAGEYSVVLWTASQTNREGARQKVVTGDTVSEAFVGKIGTADFCMSWARDKQHKDRGTAVASVLKNRFGAEGDYYAIFDTTKGYIEIFSPGSKESQMIEQGILSEEDYNKQYLRNAYKSFQKNQRLVQ